MATIPGPPGKQLAIAWRWRPRAPLPTSTPLPATQARDDALLRATALDDAELTHFRGSFPQLARQTPDLHFYRLLRLFNTPILTLSTREAGRTSYGYWSGAMPTFRDDYGFCHLWFFDDETDGDVVALEFGFEAGLTLYTERKSREEATRRFAEICRRLNAAVPGLTVGRPLVTQPPAGQNE